MNSAGTATPDTKSGTTRGKTPGEYPLDGHRRAAYRLLLVEDEPDLRSALSEFLRYDGYHITTCDRGDEVASVVREEGPFDLILLDIMLPGIDGYTVLKHLRSLGTKTPVIVLTARGDHPDVIHGFDLGADDYVPKPFSADVLKARIRAVLTRTKSPAEKPMDVHEFGEVYVNFSSNEAHRSGSEIEFTALEYKLLRYLISNRGRVLTRDPLLRDVWDLPPEVHTRTVDRHVASLRKKIEPHGDRAHHIQTVYGRGYRFVP